jgi:hypothetical protein
MVKAANTASTLIPESEYTTTVCDSCEVCATNACSEWYKIGFMVIGLAFAYSVLSGLFDLASVFVNAPWVWCCTKKRKSRKRPRNPTLINMRDVDSHDEVSTESEGWSDEEMEHNKDV